MEHGDTLGAVARSTLFWMIAFTVLLFVGLANIRPVLHVLGLLLGMLGGPGLEGTGL
jgi:hypothetical protein